MSKQYIVRLYSAQKQKETGTGSFSVCIKEGEVPIDQQRIALQNAQKEENRLYKEAVKAGNKPPQKYFPKDPKVLPTTVVKEQIQQLQPVLQTSMNANIIRTPFELILDPHTGNTAYLIGSSKRGKSTALMKIYDKYYADTSFISILWTKNPQIKLYRGHKNLLRGDRYTRESESIIKSQHRIQVKTKNNYRFLNMFDDIVHLEGNQLMEDLVMTYRNSKMSTIISMQYNNKLAKGCRANINNVLLFGMNTDEATEVMIKCYLIGYLKKIGITHLADMINWYNEATKDHSFIYVRPCDGTVSFHRFEL